MMAANQDVSTMDEAAHRQQLRRAVLAATVGTAIEWYDFFLYSTVTGLVFAHLYFPRADPLVGTLQAFGVYAVGFLARPIGAAIFGHYGDRLGRKAALIATLLLMGTATFLVALVPGYQHIGIWGGIILTVLRFIQASAWAVSGAARCFSRWSGRNRTGIADSLLRGRSSGCRWGCFSRISPSSYSAPCLADNSLLGDGAFLSCLALFWSRLASTFG